MRGMTPFDNAHIYEALVAKVRKHDGSVEIGGRNYYDIEKLVKAARRIDERLAAEEAARPLNEAAGRLNATIRRSLKAWQTICDLQGQIAENRRVHILNGLSRELLDPVNQPAAAQHYSTIDRYDEANAEASVIATELETRAQKLRGYLSSWDRSTPDQRILSIILALADRLDRLEDAAGAKAE